MERFTDQDCHDRHINRRDPLESHQQNNMFTNEIFIGLQWMMYVLTVILLLFILTVPSYDSFKVFMGKC